MTLPPGIVKARALVKGIGKVTPWEGFYAPATGEFVYIGPNGRRCIIQRHQYIDVEVL